MPNTIKLLTKLYGTPVAGKWESGVLVLWDVPADINRAFPCLPNKIYCNKDIVIPLEKVFRALMKAFWEKRLRPKDSLVTYDGCFNIRMKKGGKTLSFHSWGIAIDLNAFRNGWGKEPTFSQAFFQIWRNHGWICGGDWEYPDGMHFEYDFSLIGR